MKRIVLIMSILLAGVVGCSSGQTVITPTNTIPPTLVQANVPIPYWIDNLDGKADSFQKGEAGTTVEPTKVTSWVSGVSGQAAFLDTDDAYIGYLGSQLVAKEGAITFKYKPIPNLASVFATRHTDWTDYNQNKPPQYGFLLDTVGWGAAKTGSFSFILDPAANGNLGFGVWDGSSWRYVRWTTPQDWQWDSTRWYELGVTWGSQGLGILVDGQQKASTPDVLSIDDTGVWYLGQAPNYWPYGPHTMMGSYDEVKVFSSSTMLASVPSPTFTPTQANTPSATMQVLDTQTKEIGPSGGTISLKDGIHVIFPPGAADTANQVTISKIDPTSYFESRSDLERVVLKATASVNQFKQDVEIRIPLPDGMTEADSPFIFAGYIDETSGDAIVQKSAVQMIQGKPILVLPVSHFSTTFGEWISKIIFGEKIPDKAGPLVIPYYGQGASPYCWAAGVQMVTQAAKFDDGTEIIDIIGQMKVGQGGIGAYDFRYSSELARIIRWKTGLNPDRSMWDTVNMHVAINRIKEEIVAGHPVAMFSSRLEHAVVVIGYDGNDLFLDDPKCEDVKHTGYTKRPWNYFTDGVGRGDFLVLLSIPTTSLDSKRPQVTVNIMPKSFWFIKPLLNADDPSDMYKFEWDYTTPKGYSWISSRTSQPVQTLPGTVKTLSLRGDVDITNISPTETQTTSIWLDIKSLREGAKRYSQWKEITLGPNQTKSLKVDDIEVDEFRDNDQELAEYYLSVIAMIGGQLVDREQIRFSISKKAADVPSVDQALLTLLHDSIYFKAQVLVAGTATYDDPASTNGPQVLQSSTLIQGPKIPIDWNGTSFSGQVDETSGNWRHLLTVKGTVSNDGRTIVNCVLTMENNATGVTGDWEKGGFAINNLPIAWTGPISREEYQSVETYLTGPNLNTYLSKFEKTGKYSNAAINGSFMFGPSNWSSSINSIYINFSTR